MRILYDSKNEFYKKPFGCIKENEPCEINICIPESCQTKGVEIRFETDNGTAKTIFMKKTKTQSPYDTFGATFALETRGLYFYYFFITTVEGSFELFKEGEKDTNIGVGNKWQITCYPRDFVTPNDLYGKVMYQIFPDRFYKCGECDLDGKLTPYTVHTSFDDIPHYMPDESGKILNNDFFGGNLNGICEKLDYIQDLGVSIIYLNPIFKAFSNHRYDTCDYKTIDPMLGTEEDFVKLCDEAHKRGIKIVLDGVFSHTGCDSIYFDKYNRFGGGAFCYANSMYKSWYKFSSYPNEYESWWGIDTLPCVEELDESYLNYILKDQDSVVRKWIRLGADGFRLDVADELPDEFISMLRKTVKEENPDAIIIGEVWEDASNKIAYSVRRKYFADGELDSVMNYPFRNAIIDLVKDNIETEDFAAKISNISENYPKEVLCCLMNSLSTHDTPRILTNLTDADMNLSREDQAKYQFSTDEIQKAKQRLKLAAALQFFLPGCACIYYGDEIGMQGFGDPFNRGFFDWNNTQNEISDYYHALSKLKNSNSALQKGDIQFLSKNDGVLVMERTFETDSVTMALNLSQQSVKVDADKFLISHNATTLGKTAYVNNGGFVIYK